jgi:hypothetical protein
MKETGRCDVLTSECNMITHTLPHGGLLLWGLWKWTRLVLCILPMFAQTLTT